MIEVRYNEFFDHFQENSEKIKVVKQNMKIVHSKKSYVGNRRRPIEFEEYGHMFLNITPNIGIRCIFKKKLLHFTQEPFTLLDALVYSNIN